MLPQHPKAAETNCDDTPRWLRWVVGMILCAHVVLLCRIDFVSSPNIDELAHLPAGLSHWELGRFDLYRVNPPLVRMVAATPIVFTDAVRDWSDYRSGPYYRAEFFVGKRFVINNQFDTFRFVSMARLACIPFSLLGCIVAYVWAKELYGWRGGLVTLTLYAFGPNMLTWGASITPDAAAASTGLLSMYLFWRWLRKPGWSLTLMAGLSFGVALLTKSTWVFLFLLFPVIWLIGRRSGRTCGPAEGSPPAVQLAALLLTGIYVLNSGYAFEGSFRPLGDYPFVSKVLSGEESPPDGANRFRGTMMEKIPVPLPTNFVLGIDFQKRDFEQKKWSYLRGENKKGGWWYYYLYAFLVKNTIGFLTLLALVVLITLRGVPRISRDEAVLLIPAAFIFLLVSSQTGVNRYYRYVLPAAPFLMVYCGRIMQNRSFQSWRGWLAISLLFVATAESFSVYPYSLSFFNQCVGGPLGGPRHLLEGNVDWGQDLLELKRWTEEHPDAKPLHVAYFVGWDIDPSIAGIEYDPVPTHPDPDTPPPELKPGWYAVSANYVYGLRHFESDRQEYAYFQKLQPVDYAGYSIYIYHIQ